jgi:hypothetical protein
MFKIDNDDETRISDQRPISPPTGLVTLIPGGMLHPTQVPDLASFTS